jgi:hypothetical protein
MFHQFPTEINNHPARFCPEKRFSGTDSISGNSAGKAGGLVCLLDLIPV